MKVRFRNTSLILLALLLVATSGAFVWNDRYFEIAKSMSIFAAVYREVNEFYVDDLNPNTLMNTSIDEMLTTLDPYTNYIPEDRIEDYRTLNTGQYGGIGASTIRIDGRTFISMIFEGYPAEESDLEIGDEVVKINGIDITTKSTTEIGQLMKGQSETDVILSVRRFGENKELEIPVSRTRVTIKNVPFYGMLDANKGYIKLTEFTQKASENVRDAFENLHEKGASSIILDLRSNPGGLLLEAVNLSNIFLPKGSPVVSTKGKIEENNTDYRAMFKSIDTEIPLVVLINSTSASASEIVAGVIQDYDRGVLIGQKSYGKGLVQTTRRLSYNSQLKVTTAKYYIPSGRCIQAIDYSNRQPDGSVGHVSDSLITAFKTSNGRIVYDGGGIDPDIQVEREILPPLGNHLLSNGFVFRFATKFYYDNEEIGKPGEFQISDELYQDFVKWVKTHDFNYQTGVEKDLQNLREAARTEGKWTGIRNEYKEVEKRMLEEKNSDFERYKGLISNLLKEEIVSRYYLQGGAIRAGFSDDPYIEKAIEVLNDQNTYNKILGN